MADLDLERELDRLYALPLPEFIGARNELAKRLKAGGERQAAAEVKALAKPSVTAWAVNALFHHERQRFDALLTAAAAVRAALAGKGDRRQAEAARRAALRELLGRAAKVLAAAGHAATPANRQRISHTLETLAARDPEADGPRPGRLAADLEPQGFDVLTGLAASLAPAGGAGARATGRPAAKRSRKGTAKGEEGSAARAAPEDARLAAARGKLEAAEAELAELEREAEDAEAQAVEARERHERLVEEAAEAARVAEAAGKAAAAAKKELAAATAAATQAKAARRRGVTRVAAARRQIEKNES